MEVPAVEVRLDNSIPKEINLPSMKDDSQAPSAKEQKHLEEDEVPQKWEAAVDWSEEAAGTPVVVDGKEGVLVGLTPNKKNVITVEVDGDLIELDSRSPAVQLPSVSK